MKHLILPFNALLFLAFFGFASLNSAQLSAQNTEQFESPAASNYSPISSIRWMELLAKGETNWFVIRDAFYQDNAGIPLTQIRGYKQFNRLNNFYRDKIDENGNYDPTDEWRGYQDWLEDNPQPINSRASNWTNFGPETSPPFYNLPFQEGIGRLARISFHPTNGNIFYVGATYGGIWKTTNGGNTFFPIGDFLPSNLQAGDVVTDPSNHNHLYFASSNGDQFWGGAGIFESFDQGSNWTYIGLNGIKVDRLVMDPSNNQHLWAAGQGGLWETTDGGTNWNQHGSFTSGYVNEFLYKPGTSNTIYLTHNNGSSTRFYKSVDSGVTWNSVALPQLGTLFSQIEMDVTPHDQNFIYLFGASGTAGNNYIFKSTDSGNTWTEIANNSTPVLWEDNTLANANMFNRVTTYPGRCVMIACSPYDKNEIYVGGASMVRSTNGGGIWKDYQVATGGGGNNLHHADNIWMDWNPNTGDAFFLHDGGISKRSGSITSPLVDIANQLKITETYWINTSHDGSKFICGNQDNGTFLYDGSSWSHIGSGDGMVCYFDPGDNNTSYHSYQVGLGIGKITNGAANGGEQGGDQVTIINQASTGQTAAWVHQHLLHPVDRHVLYTAYQDVFKSEDQGATWTNVTAGSVNNNTKQILRISKADPNFLVVGDVYGAQRYFKTTNGGASWSQMTSLDGIWISDFVLDPNDANHMYYSKHGEVFESTDQGATWTSISAGLPWIGAADLAYQDGPSGGLYLAMNLGVYWRAHADASWTLYTNNDIPNVNVSAVEVVPALDKVRVGTKQRGLWESDLFNSYDGCYQASVPQVTSTVCAGTITLSSNAAPGGYTYQWYKDAQPIAGATSQNLNVTTNGRYVVIFKNGSCYSPGSYPLNIDVTALSGLPTVGTSCAALDFDGTNDAVTVNQSSALDMDEDFSIEFWMNTSTATGSYKDIILKGSAYGITTSGSNLYFVTWGDDAAFTGALRSDNEWHHYAFTASGGNTRKLYVDGVLEATNTDAYTTNISGNNLQIGDSWNNPMDCTLDELRIWNDTRTATEIADNYNESMTCFGDDLALYLAFEEGTPNGNNTGVSLLVDHSVYGHTVEIENFAKTGIASNWVNGNTRDWYPDSDGDGWGDESGAITSCVQPVGTIEKGGDCDDTDANIHPYAVEVCGNTSDDDCDGNADLIVNRALRFDGANDRVIISNPFQHQNNVTMEAWVNTTISGGIIMGWEGTNSAVIGVNGSGSLVYLENGGGYNFGVFIADGQWHHIAVVRNATQAIVYQDGVQTGVLPFNNNLTTSTFSIGGYANGNSSFNGYIDDVRIWNVALTNQQVLDRKDIRLDGNETNLQRYYHFDHGKSAQANPWIDILTDHTGNGGDGELRNFALSGTNSNWMDSWTYQSLYTDNDNDGVGSTTAWSCGTMYGLVSSNADCDDTDSDISPNLSDLEDGTDNNCNGLTNENNSLHFDGVNDNVVGPHVPSIHTANGTIEMWIYPELKPSSMTFICYRTSNGAQTRWLFNFTANLGTMGFWNGAGYQQIGNTFVANQWQHLAIVDDGTNTKVYRNGVLMGAFSQQFNTGSNSPDLRLVLGYDIPLSEYFKGRMDEVKVWSTVKTQSEIQASMNSTTCPTETGLEVYYTFDQGLANASNVGITRLDDISAGNFNGTLNNYALISSNSNFLAGSPATIPNWYLDADNDGYYVGSAIEQSCTPGTGYNTTATNSGDCDDSNPSFNVACSGFAWTGNVDTDWDENGNWSGGVPPTSVDNAIIPTTPSGGLFPTVNVLNAEANDLTVESGATLNISSGNALTVNGVLSNDGLVSVENGASLVQTTGSTIAGSGSYNVHRQGSSVYDFWSSAITNAGTGLLGGTVYQYDPALGTADASDDEHDPGWVGPGGTMAVTRGYAAQSAGSVTFSGTVNNGPLNASVTSHALPNVSFNLVGNPYPSGIDASSFLTANGGLLADGAIYLWDDPGTGSYTSGDYAVRNGLGGIAGGGGNAPTGTIGVAQGFKVNVNGNGNIQFNNSMRTAANTTMLFRQPESKLIWLSAVSIENRFNQTLIGFTEDGTDGVDWAYDAPKLNYLSDLSLYSMMGDNGYAIQGLGRLEGHDEIPLGLVSGYQTEIEIRLDSTFNLIDEQIVLEDRMLSIFHDLRSANYAVQALEEEYFNRFYLHIGSESAIGVIESDKLGFNCWNFEESLFIRSTGKVDNVSIQIFDSRGREVQKLVEQAVFEGTNEFKLASLNHGIYVVHVLVNGKSYTKKIVLN